MLTSLLLYSNFGLLLIRLALGAIFIIHGYPKLFKTHGQFAGYLKTLRVPAPKFMALVVALVEFFGGIAVIVGFLTQWAALGIAVDMLVASVLVRRKFVGGWEFDFMLFATALALLLIGAGSLSVDAILVR